MNIVGLSRVACFLTTFCLIGSCVQNVSIEREDLSTFIIGKWVQTMSFDLVDASTDPPAYDWFNVENGFTLELNSDKSFVYTRYDSCMTGTYLFDSEINRINFFFDCEFDFDGKRVAELTEYIDDTVSNNSTLSITHADESSREKNIFSRLRRID